MTEQRRLAAILVADVVGYSKLVGSDEEGTRWRFTSYVGLVSSGLTPMTNGD